MSKKLKDKVAIQSEWKTVELTNEQVYFINRITENSTALLKDYLGVLAVSNGLPVGENIQFDLEPGGKTVKMRVAPT
jgi:hypothetical protein